MHKYQWLSILQPNMFKKNVLSLTNIFELQNSDYVEQSFIGELYIS